MSHKLLALTATIIFVGLCFSGTVSAVDYGGIGGAPAYPDPANPRTQSIFVYNLKNNTTKTDGIKIFNNSDSSKTIQIYAVDSQISSGGSLACAQKVEPKKGVGSWINLEKEEVTLDSKQTEVVPFNIKVPSNADVGEHDGCLVIQDSTATKKEQNGIALSFRSALRVVITIPGDIYKKLSFSKLSSSFDNKGNVVVKVAMKNEGNVSVDVNVGVVLKNILGIKISENGGGFPVLPRSSAEWNFDFKQPYWGGLYRVFSSAEYDNTTTKPLGVTSANLTALKGPSQLIWVSPKPLAAVIEISTVLIALILIIYLVTKYQKYKKSTANWVIHSVEGRDTIKTIATMHKVSWKLIAKVNRIKPPYELKTGQKILLPPIDK